MKYILWVLLLLNNMLFAEVLTLSKYDERIHYYKNDAYSMVEGASINGFYVSYGDIDYLLEFDISHTHVDFKQNYINDFNQDDYTAMFSGYYPEFMYKFGVHFIDTDDLNLGNGMVLVGGVALYDKNQYAKVGVDSYWSHYQEGYTYKGTKGVVDIYQVSPYLEYTHIVSKNFRNNIKSTLTYINSAAYEQEDYISYAIEDTIFFKMVQLKAKAYTGEMKSAVTDGGLTVYNTKDLMKKGYGFALGYNLTNAFKINLSYDVHTFEIPDLYTINDLTTNEDVMNNVGILSFSYSY